MEKLELKIWV